MKKKLSVFTLIVVIVTLFALPTSVLADGTVNWTNHGADNLPCVIGMHIVFTPGGGDNTVTGATLYVNGGSGISMSKHANGSWWADVYGSFDSTLVMYVDYVGDLGSGQAGVQLSHCLEGTPPTPTDPTPTLPTPTDTATPTNPTPTDPATPTRPISTPPGGGGNSMPTAFPVGTVVTVFGLGLSSLVFLGRKLLRK